MKLLISSIIIIALGIIYSSNREQAKPLAQGLSSSCKLFLISEAGCMACNSKYLDFILDKAANKINTVIYSAASGMKLDISAFLADTIENVIQNDISIWENNNLKEGSYFINIKNDRIDTIIHIQPRTVNQSLNYIEKIIN